MLNSYSAMAAAGHRLHAWYSSLINHRALVGLRPVAILSYTFATRDETAPSYSVILAVSAARPRRGRSGGEVKPVEVLALRIMPSS